MTCLLNHYNLDRNHSLRVAPISPHCPKPAIMLRWWVSQHCHRGEIRIVKPTYRKLLIVVIALMLATLACNATAGDATPTVQVARVSATPTVFVPGAATATTQPPTAAAPTQTLAPGAPTNTTVCGFSYAFVTDVTIPDDKEITTGQAFTKTWRVQNNGCQKWPAGMVLFFKDGSQMGGPASVSVPETAAGGVQDISVNLTAPATPGTYTGNWMLKTPDGIVIGATPIYVRIKAVAPAAANTATPPSAPTATTGPLIVVDFTIGYAGKWKCDVFYRFGFKLDNTGNTAIESVKISINPLGGGGSSNTPFEQVPPVPAPQCLQAGLDSLAAGSGRWISSGMGTTDPGSGSASATIKGCSANDLGGVCKTVTVNFIY